MTTPSNPIKLRWMLLPALLAVVSMGFALLYLEKDEGREVERATPASGGSSSGMDDRLARIERQLERLQASVDALRVPGTRSRASEGTSSNADTGPVERSADRTGAEPSDPGLLSRLDRVERNLAAEIEELRVLLQAEIGKKSLVDRIRTDQRHVDWTAWEEVIAAWRRSPDEARRMVKLLTADELLDRFGPPSDLWSNTNGLTWQYERVLPTDVSKRQEIILRLPDGYVAQLAYREPAVSGD